MGDNNRTDLIRLLWGISELIHITYLAWFLVDNWHSINVYYIAITFTVLIGTVEKAFWTESLSMYILILSLPLTCCVDLSKSLPLSGSQCPYLQSQKAIPMDVFQSVLLGKTTFKQSLPTLQPAPSHLSSAPQTVWRCQQSPLHLNLEKLGQLCTQFGRPPSPQWKMHLLAASLRICFKSNHPSSCSATSRLVDLGLVAWCLWA